MRSYDVYSTLKERRGLNDFAVSKATGIAPATISDWKKGRSEPKSDKLQKIADYFEVSVDYLMTGKDTEKTSESGQTYYFTDETAEVAQELFENKDMKMLFDAAKDSRPEDLKMAADFLKRLKETNPDG